MRRRRAVPLLVCLVAGGSVPGGTGALAAPESGRIQISAVRTTSAVEVDGRLDEPAWENAGVIPDLTQHAPHPGEPTPYRTEVHLLIDRENLYLGIRCFDPEPAKISLHSMRRDVEDPFGDDFVTLVFDTFGDRRTGYWFEVHATGSMSDGLIPGPGIYTAEWDGIWDARTNIDGAGWTVEMRLPSRTLHFKTGLPEWGFNVLRFIPRDRTNLHWSGVTIDSDVLDLSSAGLLSGVSGLDQGHGLTVAPYALGRFESVPAEQTERTTGRGGLDLSYSLTPGLTGVLTANTDFAETEVDTRQINLTRFDLFFPEKRSFFLDGSNLFEFGLGLGQDFVPFYSRRIGLVEKGVAALESLLFAKYQMYRNVYWHHAVRSATAMFKRLVHEAVTDHVLDHASLVEATDDWLMHDLQQHDRTGLAQALRERVLYKRALELLPAELPVPLPPWVHGDPRRLAQAEDALARAVGLGPAELLIDLPYKEAMLGLDLPIVRRDGTVERLTQEGWPGRMDLPPIADTLAESACRFRVFTRRPVDVPAEAVAEVLTA